jgi:hypothetical protein
VGIQPPPGSPVLPSPNRPRKSKRPGRHKPLYLMWRRRSHNCRRPGYSGRNRAWRASSTACKLIPCANLIARVNLIPLRNLLNGRQVRQAERKFGRVSLAAANGGYTLVYVVPARNSGDAAGLKQKSAHPGVFPEPQKGKSCPMKMPQDDAAKLAANGQNHYDHQA